VADSIIREKHLTSSTGGAIVHPTLRLVILLAETVDVVPLPEDGTLTLGRTGDNDIAIDDPSVSRKHATLTLGPVPKICDLGSRNGIRVGDERIPAHTETPIPFHKSVFLGNVMILLERIPAGRRARRLWEHGYFEGRLEEECARAERNNANFALLRIRCRKYIDEQSIVSQLAEMVRSSDVLAKYGPGVYEVLLIDTNSEQTPNIAERFRKALSQNGVESEVRWSSFPGDGKTGDRLMAAAAFDVDTGPLDVSIGKGMAPLRAIVDRIAPTDISVLIMGETGVGKDVLASQIHRASKRAEKPYLRLNCAAISETLLESELFGYERGAFTGAQTTKPGLLETADGGTVLFDEIGELPLSLQAKLLRVIEERTVLRVGGLKPRSIDVRIISATNRDLEQACIGGIFRQDLYFRLNGISLMLPPLRERLDEIEPLILEFIKEACRVQDRPLLTMTREAMDLCLHYTWPGNIRELKNVIERAVILCTGPAILIEHLPHEKILATVGVMRRPRTTPRPTVGVANREYETTASVKTVKPPESEPTTSPGHRLGSEAPERADEPATPLSVWRNARANEREAIIAALQQCGGNQTNAAKLLGISRRTLCSRLDRYGITRPRKKGAQLDSADE
jgi:DNA-binding NtrC family response regulator